MATGDSPPLLKYYLSAIVDSVNMRCFRLILVYYKGSDMEFVKCFTLVRFPEISIRPLKKRVNRDSFGKQLIM